MTLYKPKTSSTVEAVQLTDITTVVGWLWTNYAGHWSLESDHDPSSIFLAVDTPAGRAHGIPSQWLIARGVLPAVYLEIVDNSVFVASYDLV